MIYVSGLTAALNNLALGETPPRPTEDLPSARQARSLSLSSNVSRDSNTSTASAPIAIAPRRVLPKAQVVHSYTTANLALARTKKPATDRVKPPSPLRTPAGMSYAPEPAIYPPTIKEDVELKGLEERHAVLHAAVTKAKEIDDVLFAGDCDELREEVLRGLLAEPTITSRRDSVVSSSSLDTAPEMVTSAELSPQQDTVAGLRGNNPALFSFDDWDAFDHELEAEFGSLREKYVELSTSPPQTDDDYRISRDRLSSGPK